MQRLTLKKQYTFEDLLRIEKQYIINYCVTANRAVFNEVKEVFKRQKQYDDRRDEEIIRIFCPYAHQNSYYLVLVNDMLRSDLFEEGNVHE